MVSSSKINIKSSVEQHQMFLLCNMSKIDKYLFNFFISIFKFSSISFFFDFLLKIYFKMNKNDCCHMELFMVQKEKPEYTQVMELDIDELGNMYGCVNCIDNFYNSNGKMMCVSAQIF